MSFFLTPWNSRRNTTTDNFNNNGIFEAFDRMLDTTFANSGGFLVQPTTSGTGPQSYVTTTDTEHRIDIAIPGVPKDAVNVSVANGALTVGYESTAAFENLTNVFSTSFTKTWTLPDGVDVEAITATSENGVLTVTLPYANTQGFAGRTITVE